MVIPQLSCAPKYLVSQGVQKNDGVGPVLDLDDLRGKLLVVALGINEVAEQEDLAISIWGSSTGTDWGTKPLVLFPQKSYCGIYATLLNLTKNPGVRFLRVQWAMNRWTQRNTDLMFGFYVSVEEMHSEASAAVA